MKWRCLRCRIHHHVVYTPQSLDPKVRANRSRCGECRVPFFWAGQTEATEKTRLYIVQKEAQAWMEEPCWPS